MKKILTLLVGAFCLTPGRLTAQVPGELEVDYSNRGDWAMRLLQLPNSERLLFSLVGWPQGFGRDPGLHRLDQELNVLDARICAMQTSSEPSVKTAFVRDSTIYASFVGLRPFSEGVGGTYPLYAAMNFQGDTLWTKQILRHDTSNWITRAIAPLSDGKFISLCANREGPNSPAKICLFFFDSAVNLLDTKISTLGIWVNPYSLLVTDNAIYVGGVYYPNVTSSVNTRSHQFVRKFDLQGNVLWTHTKHVAPYGREFPVFALLEREDGNIVYTGGRSNGTTPLSESALYNDRTKPAVGVLNKNNGNLLFEKTFNHPSPNQGFLELKKVSSGGYIGTGWHKDTTIMPHGQVSFIARLDDNLDAIWYRYYKPQNYNNIGVSKFWLRDVIENDNGTFTAVGELVYYTGTGPQSGYVTNSYIMTVDAQEGCIIPGCWVGLTEDEPPLQSLLAYPNPASEVLYIDLPQTDNWQLQLYSLQGRAVQQTTYSQTNQIRHNTQELPTGIYLLVATGSTGQQWKTKVVIR